MATKTEFKAAPVIAVILIAAFLSLVGHAYLVYVNNPQAWEEATPKYQREQELIQALEELEMSTSKDLGRVLREAGYTDITVIQDSTFADMPIAWLARQEGILVHGIVFKNAKGKRVIAAIKE